MYLVNQALIVAVFFRSLYNSTMNQDMVEKFWSVSRYILTYWYVDTYYIYTIDTYYTPTLGLN